MTLTEKQFEIRKSRVGSSDIAAILGISPHATALDVFTRKDVPEADPESTPAQDWGHALERSILQYDARKHGLVLLDDHGTLIHARRDFACATPDAIAVVPTTGTRHVIEAKSVGSWMAHGWGAEGTDDCPLYFLCQVQWEIGVTKSRFPVSDEAYLVASIEGGAPLRYVVGFDADLFGTMLEAAEKFVRDHLETRIPPPLDGSSSAAEYLRRRYPENTSANMLPATDEARKLVEELRIYQESRKFHEAEEDRCKHLLQQIIGEHSGIEGLVSWKKDKDSRETVIDWRAAAQDIASEFRLDLTKYAKPHTKDVVTRTGARKLRLLNSEKKKKGKG